jgi:hypothetical protein
VAPVAVATVTAAPVSTILSMDEDEMSPDQLQCKDALRAGEQRQQQQQQQAAHDTRAARPSCKHAGCSQGYRCQWPPVLPVNVDPSSPNPQRPMRRNPAMPVLSSPATLPCLCSATPQPCHACAQQPRSLRPLQTSPPTSPPAGKRLLKEKNGAAAMVRFEKALMLSKALGDRVQERRAERGLAAAARLQSQFRAAIGHLERVLDISREMKEYTGGRRGTDCCGGWAAGWHS